MLKMLTWTIFKHTGNKITNKIANRADRVVLHRKHFEEMRLIYAEDKKAFYSHIRHKVMGAPSVFVLMILL